MSVRVNNCLHNETVKERKILRWLMHASNYLCLDIPRLESPGSCCRVHHVSTKPPWHCPQHRWATRPTVGGVAAGGRWWHCWSCRSVAVVCTHNTVSRPRYSGLRGSSRSPLWHSWSSTSLSRRSLRLMLCNK